ncbi:Enolase-like protein ENO4 [Oryzias melastigma]|uniref:Enolase 4 n=1 Tax=Oryzias melastigma TaxID=30732 RepID=A0A834FN87_ORYME|nr:Enolase-like protein ENO4 [Oryzias melastigma]
MSHGGSSGSLLAEEDMEELRGAAAEFYRQSGVVRELEEALDQLFRRRPRDLHGFLADYFDKLSAPPLISRLKGREVYDARGQLCIEAEVFCVVRNTEKSVSSAAVSCCLDPKTTSADSEDEERTEHVTTAAQWINGPLSNMLKDRSPCDQSEVDQMLSDFFMTRCLEDKEMMIHSPSMEEESSPSSPPAQDKDKKIRDKGKKNNTVEKPFPPAEPPEPVLHGSTAIGSVSLAVAKAGAELQRIPLYHHIAALKSHQVGDERFHIPVSLVTLICCGRTSPGKLNLLEEVILVPKPGQPVIQTVTMTLQLQKEMMRIMTATRAGSKGKYEVAAGVLKSPDELVDLYQTLLHRHPAVVALIDPFRREDKEQWEKLSSAVGNACSLISDVTNVSQLPVGGKGCIVKLVHETTISDLIRISSQPGSVMLGLTQSEPCSDASLSDLAVGLGLDYIKLGGLHGAERMTKYNRLISIEEELAQRGILVNKDKHSPPFPGAVLHS